MSTRRRVQLAQPHVHRAALVAIAAFVIYVGSGLAVAEGVAVGPFIQAVPYLFVGVVVRTTVTSGMPHRQFQFALVLLVALFLGMGVVSLQQYLLSEVTAARAYLLLIPLNLLGVGFTVRGWLAARSA
ncbi:MAG: hypothetical protein ABEJ35_04135 [Halobacteriaceae archaeon]